MGFGDFLGALIAYEHRENTKKGIYIYKNIHVEYDKRFGTYDVVADVNGKRRTLTTTRNKDMADFFVKKLKSK